MKWILRGLAVLCAVFLPGLFLLPAVCTASAAESMSAYSYTIEKFETEMKVERDRTVRVTEKITCSFSGYDSHGIIRDLPLGDGVRYTHLKAECDSADFSPYTKTDDSSFLSLYLRGNGVVSGQTRTYTLSYDMNVPAFREGYLSLDVLGYGWQAPIYQFSAKITLPEGLREYKIYSGEYGSRGNSLNPEVRAEGNVYFLSLPKVGYNRGITLDLQFEKGALGISLDPTLPVSLAVAAFLICLAAVLKAVFFKQPILTSTVNFEAPEKMDPLLMGKLIDNKIDSEDLGALVFYLADRGYLTIDLRFDEKNPTLVKKGEISPEEPEYVKRFFSGLFVRGNRVVVNSLAAKFYSTAESVKAGAELAAGKTYSAKGKTFLWIFGALSAVLWGVFSIACHLLLVFRDYFYWAGIPVALISYALSAFGSVCARQKEYKWKRRKRIFFQAGMCVLSLLSFLIFMILPSAAFGIGTLVVMTVSSAAAGMIAGGAFVRTEEYSARLGQIVGFKQFILMTERDKIEFMLKDNPDLYYHILPYAQVLGVTDAWTEKFQGLSLRPPEYMQTSSPDVFDAILFCGIYRNLCSGMGTTFVSRPSSSGGGVNHGGFGGGFGGGGFGGGGGRGC